MLRTELQETFVVEDNFFFDSGSQEHISLYDNRYFGNASFTYDSSNNAYKLVNNGYDRRTLLLPSITYSPNVKISMDTMFGQTNNNTQPQIIFVDKDTVTGVLCSLQAYSGGHSVYIDKITLPQTQSHTSSGDVSVETQYSANTWYHFELIIDNGTYTAKVYDSTGETLLWTTTASQSGLFAQNNNILAVAIGYNPSASIWFKNLKVKAL